MRHVEALSSFLVVRWIQVSVFIIVKASQARDPNCELIRELIERNKDYELRKGILYRFVDGAWLLVVPKQMQVIRHAHERGHVESSDNHVRSTSYTTSVNWL